LVRRYYTGKKPLRRIKDKRARRIIDHISKRLKLKVVDAQVPVVADEYKLKTSIDLLGVRQDAIVVLEIKTTQFSLAQHNIRYNRLCIGAPTLRNKIPNSESMHHRLQTGFGVMGLRRLLPPGTPVVGRVIVATEDAVQSYGCPDTFTKPSLFATAMPLSERRATSARARSSVKLMDLPEAPEDQHRVMAELAPLGLTRLCPTIKTDASFVVSTPVIDSTDVPEGYAVVAIMHDPEVSRIRGRVAQGFFSLICPLQGAGTKASKYRKVRDVVVGAAAKHRKKLGPTQPIILTFNSTTGVFTRHMVRSTKPK
jgi:hypothetical protein